MCPASVGNKTVPGAAEVCLSLSVEFDFEILIPFGGASARYELGKVCAPSFWRRIFEEGTCLQFSRLMKIFQNKSECTVSR